MFCYDKGIAVLEAEEWPFDQQRKKFGENGSVIGEKIRLLFTVSEKINLLVDDASQQTPSLYHRILLDQTVNLHGVSRTY